MSADISRTCIYLLLFLFALNLFCAIYRHVLWGLLFWWLLLQCALNSFLVNLRARCVFVTHQLPQMRAEWEIYKMSWESFFWQRSKAQFWLSVLCSALKMYNAAFQQQESAASIVLWHIIHGVLIFGGQQCWFLFFDSSHQTQVCINWYI
jgi:hypothetical protein